jgi:putative DNA primase/helicase
MPSKNGGYPPTGSAYPEKVEVAFLKAMEAVFGPLDFIPVANNIIQRFDVPGDRVGSHNGWYVLHPSSPASGTFGSWKVGNWHNWNIRKPTTLLEVVLVRQRIKQDRRQQEIEQFERQQQAAENARRLWDRSGPANAQHSYLVAKGCQPHNLRQFGTVLLVPLYFDGHLVNLQRIAADGSKRYLFGGRTKGCYSSLGSMKQSHPIYVCEGWATGATIHEETGYPVACAMTAGNLLEAGDHLQRRYPEAVLIIAGDDDRLTKGNPGRTKAHAAAAALNCGVVLPDWPADAPLHLSDFNDLRQLREGSVCPPH